MAKKIFLILCTFVVLGLVGCTHALHQYHVADTPKIDRRGDYKRISAQKEQFVILGFVTETLYVDQAFEELKNRCPNGEIVGIHSRYSTSHGFLSWTNKVKMTANCVN